MRNQLLTYNNIFRNVIFIHSFDSHPSWIPQGCTRISIGVIVVDLIFIWLVWCAFCVWSELDKLYLNIEEIHNPVWMIKHNFIPTSWNYEYNSNTEYRYQYYRMKLNQLRFFYIVLSRNPIFKKVVKNSPHTLAPKLELN